LLNPSEQLKIRKLLGLLFPLFLVMTSYPVTRSWERLFPMVGSKHAVSVNRKGQVVEIVTSKETPDDIRTSNSSCKWPALGRYQPCFSKLPVMPAWEHVYKNR
jgi:hypothetical protein